MEYILHAHYSAKHDNWYVTRKYETLVDAVIMAHIVLTDPFLTHDLYSLSICDKKGLIVVKFDPPIGGKHVQKN